MVYHWQFIRLLGGTFSLAIGATIINNSLRHTMTALRLAPATIAKIVDDPTLLGARTSASASSLADLGVSAALAERILGAYISGFRTVFILNTALNAVATVAAIFLIRHIELTRGDEEVLKQKAVEEAGGNGFMAVAATHAALLMAQGAGRLVRATGDRGVVAVLDPRLANARYGSYLRASLPDFWYTTDPNQARRSLAAIDAAAKADAK